MEGWSRLGYGCVVRSTTTGKEFFLFTFSILFQFTAESFFECGSSVKWKMFSNLHVKELMVENSVRLSDSKSAVEMFVFAV